MPQAHMRRIKFAIVLAGIPAHSVVHLQGEGEPLLHPDILWMINECRDAGHLVTTTTNGTVPFDINLFYKLEVSVDTLDRDKNKASGRLHFGKTLKNLDKWIAIDPTKIVIRTTDYGQGIQSVYDYCTLHGLRPPVIQPLNQKADYAVCYAVDHSHIEFNTVQCAFRSSSRYYNIDGLRVPCCFIKFPTQTYEENRQSFSRNIIPNDCRGCQFLHGNTVDLITTYSV